MQKTLLMYLLLIYLWGIHFLSAITYPVKFGAGDPFACSTTATAMDSDEETATKFLVCGTTTSTTLTQGHIISKCTDNPVPFAVAFDGDSQTGLRTFWSTVTYPPDSTMGLFTEAIACKLSERNKWSNANKATHNILILKLEALATQSQPTTHFLVYMADGTLDVSKILNMQGKVGGKDDLLLTVKNQGSQNAVNN